MDILMKIRERRMALGLKQEDLSEMAGVSLATIKDIDRGVGNPSLKTIEKIADILGLELKLMTKN